MPPNATRKTRPRTTPIPATHRSVVFQVKVVRSPATSNGPTTRLSGGAICWTERALPHSSGLTMAVMVATDDGNWSPARKPKSDEHHPQRPNRPGEMGAHQDRRHAEHRKEHGASVVQPGRDEPRQAGPDEHADGAQRERARPPARRSSGCPRLMVGMSGEKMNRETNVKKNSRVTTITVPTTARNGIGVGHALAIGEW